MSTEPPGTEMPDDRAYNDAVRDDIAAALREQWSALPDWELQAAARAALTAVKPFLDSAWQNSRDWHETATAAGAKVEQVRADCELMAAKRYPADTDEKVWLSGVWAQAKRTLNILKAPAGGEDQ